MALTHPWMLVAGAVLPVIWWATRRASVPIPRWRLGLRSMSVLLLVLGAAGLHVPTGAAPETVLVLWDRSASIPLAAQTRMTARVAAMAQRRGPDDQVGVIAFGSEAAVERRPSSRPVLQGPRASVGEGASNVAAALRLARATLPTDGNRRVVLFSDGRDTVGDTDQEARRLAAVEIPLDVLAAPVDERTAPVQVARVVAPSDVRAGEPFRVAVEAVGPAGARTMVTVRRNDLIVAERELVVGTAHVGRVVVSDRVAVSGTVTYTAAIETDDGGDPLSHAGAAVVVAGPPAVLYATDGAPQLVEVLRRGGYDVDVVSPRRVPTTRAGLSHYAAVIFDDVASDAVPAAALATVADYVERDAGGLLVLGDARTLDAAGYPTSPLDRVLPVDLRPRSGHRAPAVDLVLVFDKSGSMVDVAEGLQKIDVARQAVAEAVVVMPRTDAIGIIAFDTRPTEVAPLTPGLDVQTVRDALSRVPAGGSTAIAPALDRALAWLEAGRPGARRQVLLLSDGRTSDEDARRLRALARARRAEVSVVALGDTANRGLLEELAASSGGRAYFPTGLRELPRAVAREASRAAGGGVVEESFHPVGRPHQALGGIDLTGLPILGGYAVGAAKPGADAPVVSHLGDPVLASWDAGVGRVAVFTAGLGSTWGRTWRSWRDGPQLWTQVVRWLSRREEAEGLDVSLADTARGPRLAVLAVDDDGAPRNVRAVTAMVHGPGGTVTPLALRLEAPGRFESPVAVSDSGAYTVATTVRLDDGREQRISRAVYWSADREHRAPGVDTARLAGLAAATGGRVLTDASNPFEGDRPHGWRDVSGWCVWAALLVFLVELVMGAGRTFAGIHGGAVQADKKAGSLL